jgi:hypothetical protein
MVFLLVVNTLSTAVYTVVWAISLKVYGNANASFLDMTTSISQFSIGTFVFVYIALIRDSSSDKHALISPSGVPDQPEASPEDPNGPKPNPKWVYIWNVFVIAACCAVSNFVDAIVAVQISYSIQGVLNLLLVPCVYFLTTTLLNRSLPKWCAIGATLVVLGAFVAVAPPLFSSNADDDADLEGEGGPSVFTQLMCAVLYALTNLPYAYQYIVTERMFLAGNGLWALEVSCARIDDDDGYSGASAGTRACLSYFFFVQGTKQFMLFSLGFSASRVPRLCWSIHVAKQFDVVVIIVCQVSSGWLEVALLVLITPLQSPLLLGLGEEPESFSWGGGWACFLGRAKECRDDGNGGLRPVWWPAAVHCAVGKDTMRRSPLHV